jgi:hypothetical protein
VGELATSAPVGPDEGTTFGRWAGLAEAAPLEADEETKARAAEWAQTLWARPVAPLEELGVEGSMARAGLIHCLRQRCKAPDGPAGPAVTVGLPTFLWLGQMVAAGLTTAADAMHIDDAIALYELACIYNCNECPPELCGFSTPFVCAAQSMSEYL